jgi:hypothetical protein
MAVTLLALRTGHTLLPRDIIFLFLFFQISQFICNLYTYINTISKLCVEKICKICYRAVSRLRHALVIKHHS